MSRHVAGSGPVALVVLALGVAIPAWPWHHDADIRAADGRTASSSSERVRAATWPVLAAAASSAAASGTGRVAIPLAERGCAVTVVDASPTCSRSWRQKIRAERCTRFSRT
jgi:hypothetical protein